MSDDRVDVLAYFLKLVFHLFLCVVYILQKNLFLNVVLAGTLYFGSRTDINFLKVWDSNREKENPSNTNISAMAFVIVCALVE